MFDYGYDKLTGGLILLDRDTVKHSNEPRPVYAAEMDSIGMDAFWRYDKQMDTPYMWAEANSYYYRGDLVARVKGGSLYEQPVLDLAVADDKKPLLAEGTVLVPVDIPSMVERNQELMTVLEQITLKIIYNYYKRNEARMDCFHVAFSGGKDSIVLLDLVKKALPKTSFLVVFGNTGMEFPDTYKLVDIVEQQCKEEGVAFYRAESHFRPMESWKLFGPPSRVLRWCCSVHKATPQTLKIREILGKNDYIGSDIVGVRSHESATRANYDYESYGKKQRGQYSLNPILDWSSAEIWLYIFTNGLEINEAYKKGNARAGCLFCPMSSGKADYFRNKCYPEEIQKYTDAIRLAVDDSEPDSYISNGGWLNRRNGRDLKNNPQNYFEETRDGMLYIHVSHPRTDWREWIKTLGEVRFDYKVEGTPDEYVVKVSASHDKTTDMKYFKQVFHKAASCVGCRVCEANCSHGCLSFQNGLHIEKCLHCKQCHNIDDGCLVYHSIQLPKNGGFNMKSINSFADHAPKQEWVRDFFLEEEMFLEDNTLGPMQIQMFRKFLAASSLISKGKVTDFEKLVKNIGAESATSWGLIYVNLVYSNPQFDWYVRNMEIGSSYTREALEAKIQEYGVSVKDSKSVVKAFKRFTDIPLGTVLHFGSVKMNGRQIVSLTRTKAVVEDLRIILYCLYKFAEACDGYYQFSLSRLLDFTVESAGISPALLFGLTYDEMIPILLGLSAKYPEFINASFTHDLEKIELVGDKTAEDVLKLFEEEV